MIKETILATSSIGTTWPPAIAPYNRVRGIYDSVISDPDDVARFVDIFGNVQQETESCGEATRLSIRALCTAPAISRIEESGIDVEGAVPLRRQPLYLTYTSWNSDDRTPSDEIMTNNVRVINQVATSHHSDMVSRLVGSDSFQPRTINGTTPEATKRALLSEFVGLYAIFGYNQDDVEAILHDENNTIAFAMDDDGITSTAMAERATINIPGAGDLNVVEITEAVTREDQRGRGLYTAVSGHLLDSLRRDPSVDMVYGESNLAMRGVLRAAHQNGRRFNLLDRQDLGVRGNSFGILRQNFAVNDGVERRPYNDFALSYLPLK